MKTLNEHELNYTERLTIRKALERFSTTSNNEHEREEAERLQWLFKDAEKVVVTVETD